MGIHVLCPNCGTEFELSTDNNSHVLDPNSLTDGTYFLVPKQICNANINLENIFNNLQNATIDNNGNIIIPQGENNMQIINDNNASDDIFAEFDDMHNINDYTSHELDEIESSIINNGYIPNNRLWRRWIMAQMLRHYKTKDGESGFDKYFVSGKPYLYSWETAANEIKVLSKLSGQELLLRERFFNITVINEMAIDYEKRFWKYFNKLKRHYDKNYNRKNKHESKEVTLQHTYVCLPRYGRIYMSDDSALTKSTDMTISTLKDIISTHVDKISQAKNYKELYKSMLELMKNCPMSCKIMKSYAWKNAFKGTGAYYTMDNMIKFHNCKWYDYSASDGKCVPLSTNKSLQKLEETTNNCVNEYYKLYAIMCKFIDDNNFDFQKRMEELGVD